jgi:hypothetical protein
MKYSKAFSLSLQRELEKRQLAMDSEIHKAFHELRIKSLLHLSNIRKKRG